VFTKDPIAAGSLLERCPMMYLEPEDTPSGGTLMDYVFDGGEGSWLALGLTSLVNHADEPNAEVETDEDQQVIRLRAIRDIAAGEELFIHYGESYFVDRGYDQSDGEDTEVEDEDLEPEPEPEEPASEEPEIRPTGSLSADPHRSPRAAPRPQPPERNPNRAPAGRRLF
jgi:hypothetical protein